MLIRLGIDWPNDYSLDQRACTRNEGTYEHKELTSKQSLPGLLGIVRLVEVDEDGPMIPWNHQFLRFQPCLDAM